MIDFAAGEMKHQISFVTPSTALTEGEEVYTYGAATTIWANVMPLMGKMADYWQGQFAEAQYKIEIRYRTGITSKTRVTFNGRTFELVAPPQNLGEENIKLILLAKEVGG